MSVVMASCGQCGGRLVPRSRPLNEAVGKTRWRCVGCGAQCDDPTIEAK